MMAYKILDKCQLTRFFSLKSRNAIKKSGVKMDYIPLDAEQPLLKLFLVCRSSIILISLNQYSFEV